MYHFRGDAGNGGDNACMGAGEIPIPSPHDCCGLKTFLGKQLFLKIKI